MIQEHTRILTRAVSALSQLPTAPTYDWATKAAHALTPLHPNAMFAVIIARHQHDINRLDTQCVGVGLGENIAETYDSDHARFALDRIANTLINITPEHTKSGIVTRATTLLTQWITNPLSEPWTDPDPSHPTLAAFAPITPRVALQPIDPSITPATSLATIILATTPNAAPFGHTTPSLSPDLIAQAMSVLNYKSTRAFGHAINNSIQWLTEREQAILDQLIIGNSVREIAESIRRSPHTVHDHVKNLHRKLGASSRGQLIAKALGFPNHTSIPDLSPPVIDPQLLTAVQAPQQNQPMQQATPLSKERVQELKLQNPYAPSPQKPNS